MTKGWRIMDIQTFQSVPTQTVGRDPVILFRRWIVIGTTTIWYQCWIFVASFDLWLSSSGLLSRLIITYIPDSCVRMGTADQRLGRIVLVLNTILLRTSYFSVMRKPFDAEHLYGRLLHQRWVVSLDSICIH